MSNVTTNHVEKSKKELARIPGKKISKQDKLIKVFVGEGQEFAIPIDFGVEYPGVLAPTVLTFIKDNGKDKNIFIQGVAFVNSDYGVKKDQFEFYYNFTYKSSGEYQLNIYMTFIHSDKNNEQGFRYYPFLMEFYEGAVKCSEEEVVSLEKIKTVELFVVNRNPEASRGTVTTVKPSSGTEGF
ncbi:hypothetical protein [Tenacibaculum sp. M341]|uniref:hypothetical protein n=1 Tax=Tenacibaculum sp. M341 TaxID=2530339 RepID=UPI0010472DE4|nr:hypothetical protein [Tenacibaculum sp. M341]TCI84442.1 hypothetical protein EYW44_21535 [Tenacibaculum sp. M341]